MAKNEKKRVAVLQGIANQVWWICTVHYPWLHPLNKVPDCLCITADGCVIMKFTVLSAAESRSANGDLRLTYKDGCDLDYEKAYQDIPLETVFTWDSLGTLLMAIRDLANGQWKNVHVEYATMVKLASGGRFVPKSGTELN